MPFEATCGQNAPKINREHRRTFAFRRARLALSVGGEGPLRVLAYLWIETQGGKLDFRMDGVGPLSRIDIKALAARAKMPKREIRDTLNEVIQEMPTLPRLEDDE